jgi:hypothetical protein
MTSKEDFLDVDVPIPGQNFCCLSFISPENVIADKNAYLSTHFLRFLIQNEEAYNELKKNPDFQNVKEKYDDFMYAHSESLDKKYNEENSFQTSVRGVKIRGTYESIKEAQAKAEMLRKRDPNFHVYVGQVGYWLPWDPNPDKIEDQNYAESDLNTLMKKYKENQDNRDELYEQLKSEKVKEAKKETKEKKKKYNQNKPAVTEKESLEKIAEFRNILTNKEALIKDKTETSKDQEVNKAQMSDMLNKIDEMDPWMKRKLEENNTTVKEHNDVPSGIEEVVEEQNTSSTVEIEKPTIDSLD